MNKQKIVIIETSDIGEEMLRFLTAQNWNIAAVTTFLDSRIHLAIELANRLKVPGPAEIT